jgi:hypothetical protein
MLAAYKNSVNSALRVIAPSVVLIINVIFAALAMGGYCVNTESQLLITTILYQLPGRQGVLRIFLGGKEVG